MFTDKLTVRSNDHRLIYFCTDKGLPKEVIVFLELIKVHLIMFIVLL